MSVLLVLVVVLDKRDANNNIYYRPLLILVIHYSKDFLKTVGTANCQNISVLRIDTGEQNIF